MGTFEFSAANVWPVGWKLATQPYILGGLACYVISVVVWIMALSRVEVSIAYPMLSVGYVLNAIAAWYLFGGDAHASGRHRRYHPGCVYHRPQLICD